MLVVSQFTATSSSWQIRNEWGSREEAVMGHKVEEEGSTAPTMICGVARGLYS